MKKRKILSLKMVAAANLKGISVLSKDTDVHVFALSLYDCLAQKRKPAVITESQKL